MNITSELLLEYKKHHKKEFNFQNFGNNDRMWGCYISKIRCGNLDCLFDYNPHSGTLSMLTHFHLIYISEKILTIQSLAGEFSV